MLWAALEAKLSVSATQAQEKKHHGRKIPLAIVGKPNAGKSTLMNTLAKQAISKVEDKP